MTIFVVGEGNVMVESGLQNLVYTCFALLISSVAGPPQLEVRSVVMLTRTLLDMAELEQTHDWS